MVFSFSRTLNLAQRDVPDTIKTCFNTSVENKREARGEKRSMLHAHALTVLCG